MIGLPYTEEIYTAGADFCQKDEGIMLHKKYTLSYNIANMYIFLYHTSKRIFYTPPKNELSCLPKPKHKSG